MFLRLSEACLFKPESTIASWPTSKRCMGLSTWGSGMDGWIGQLLSRLDHYCLRSHLSPQSLYSLLYGFRLVVDALHEVNSVHSTGKEKIEKSEEKGDLHSFMNTGRR